METVEVRLPPVAVAEPFISLVGDLSAGTNPARGRVLIRYGLPESGAVTLSVYDVRGNKVRTLLDRREAGGVRALVWNGSDDAGRELPVGTYVIRLAGRGWATTRSIVLLR